MSLAGRLALAAIVCCACTQDRQPANDFIPLPYAYQADQAGVSDGECQLGASPGLMAWLCLTETAPASEAAQKARRGLVMVKATAQDECPTRDEPGWVTYGCWSSASVNDPHSRIILHTHTIGPNSVCPHGTPMEAYTPACWRQFYAVLKHEIEHDVFGPSYGHKRLVGGYEE